MSLSAVSTGPTSLFTVLASITWDSLPKPSSPPQWRPRLLPGRAMASGPGGARGCSGPLPATLALATGSAPEFPARGLFPLPHGPGNQEVKPEDSALPPSPEEPVSSTGHSSWCTGLQDVLAEPGRF